MDCLFCKIVAGQIPSKKVYEDSNVLGFFDIAPLAKIHVLFIHKKHCANINEMMAEDADKIRDVFKAITHYAKNENLGENGFRVVTNTGKDAGQTVFHTHFHLLSGERLGGFGRLHK